MRPRSPRTSPNRQILQEASAWFVDFRVGDVDACAREEFYRWLRRSPEHIQAHLEIAGTYAELPAPNGSLDMEALVARARSRPDNIVEPSAWRQPWSEPRPSRLNRRRPYALATSILLVLAVLGVLFYTQRGIYRTDIGEQRSLVLADGSTLELNSNSAIRVRYDEQQRHIDLIEGQALFYVARDEQRPFIVKTGDTRVRAVGTQFDVYRKSRGTIVTVIEGHVAVLPRAPRSQQALLAAGEQLTVAAVLPSRTATGSARGADIEPPLHITRPNIAAATAWTTRQLIFEATPLAEVAEEFNRYNTRQIIVDTRQLSDFHVSGTYSSTNPQSLLLFLRSQPGIRLIETGREIRVILQSKGSEPYPLPDDERSTTP